MMVAVGISRKEKAFRRRNNPCPKIPLVISRIVPRPISVSWMTILKAIATYKAMSSPRLTLTLAPV